MEISSLEIIREFCKRPTMWNSEITASKELVAAIRGICTGAGDPQGNVCLRGFPDFVRSRLSCDDAQSIFRVLSFLVDRMSLREACLTVLGLMEMWKNTNPPEFPCDAFVPVGDDHDDADWYVYQLIEDALRAPQSFVPEASSLGELLAFSWGIKVRRHPLTASIQGSDKFGSYVIDHFHSESHLRTDVVFLQELKDRPFLDACLAIADLIKSWREAMRQGKAGGEHGR